MRRIVVGVDDSKPAGRALQWALDEAELRTVDVTVVHGHFSPRYEFFEGFESDDQMERERTRAHDEAVQVLDRALEAVRAPAGVDIERITSAGTAAGVLLQHAGPDRLAVVGRSGHGPVGRVLLGSVSHQVLHHATGPVAIIP